MDESFLNCHDDDALSHSESDDSIAEKDEIESRLYSLIHHNDLSHGVPANLQSEFDVGYTKDGEMYVAFKDTGNNIDAIVAHSQRCREVSNDVKHTNTNENELKAFVESVPKKQKKCSAQNTNELFDTGDVIIDIVTPMKAAEKTNPLLIKKSSKASKGELRVKKLSKVSNVERRKQKTTNLATELNNKTLNLKKDLKPVLTKFDSKGNESCPIVIDDDNDDDDVILISDSCEPRMTFNTSGRGSTVGVTDNVIASDRLDVKLKRSAYKKYEIVPKKWTRKMVRFYLDKSHENRSFDCFKIIKKLRAETTRLSWQVSPQDCEGRTRERGKVRCRNCNQPGHLRYNCPDPVRQIVCHMCGTIGHSEVRCPRSICLTCGSRTQLFVKICSKCSVNTYYNRNACEICQSRTHDKTLCPDLWRRFHLTTKGDSVMVPEVVTENPRKFCCKCAQHGHFSHQCNEVIFSDYPCASPFVSNYNLEIVKEISSLKLVKCSKRRSDLMPTLANSVDTDCRVTTKSKRSKIVRR